MSDTVIRVENLGKRYLLKHQQQGRSRYVALRDVIADGVKAIGQQILHPKQHKPSRTREEFWALKDVSFEVKRGEVVGIIGRNGAGKSTLLKLLSRITEPTTGRISVKGRVGSLLEVGTGFHPELTGRENIYLNGAILGMTKAEIRRKFDEIVDFAEVDKFLDTPVKHYSSGMYVRLAFAVAAYLDPEILVIDEVLAVGDAAFQKKCLEKMENISTQEGRTILFVSHNLDYLRKYFNHSLLIDKGSLLYEGNIQESLKRYQGLLREDSFLESENRNVYINNNFRNVGIHSAEVKINNLYQEIVETGDRFELNIVYYVTSEVRDIEVGFGVLLDQEEWLFGGNTKHFGTHLNNAPGEYKLKIVIPRFIFYTSRDLHINLYFGYIEDDYQIIKSAFILKGSTKDIYNSGYQLNERYCKVMIPDLKVNLSSSQEI